MKGFITTLLLIVVGLAGYVTHIVWAINAAALSGKAIALLIVGLIISPVGVLHGWSLWLGFTWIGM